MTEREREIYNALMRQGFPGGHYRLVEEAKRIAAEEKQPHKFPHPPPPLEAFGNWGIGSRWIGRPVEVDPADLVYQGVSEKGVIFWSRTLKKMLIRPRGGKHRFYEEI